MKRITTFQIGKFGLTEGVIQSLTLSLKNHKQVRVSALKASGRNRENIEQMAKDIISKLTDKCDYRTIGFTIIVTKIPERLTKRPSDRHKGRKN